VRTWGRTPRKQRVKPVVEKVLEEATEQKADNQENNEELENNPDEPQEEEEQTELKEEVKEVVVEQEKIVFEQLREGDFQSRVPLEQFQSFKDMEEMVLGLQKENLKAIVICPGIFYGAGEIIFKKHFQAAWKQQPAQLPFLGAGDNNIPTINVKDLIRFVIKVSESPPEADRYLLFPFLSQGRGQLEGEDLKADNPGDLHRGGQRTGAVGAGARDVLRGNAGAVQSGPGPAAQQHPGR